MGNWLIAVGASFQVIGLVGAGLGARKTWQEFGTEPFWEFVAAPSRRAWDWIKTRVLRRPVTVQGVMAAIELEASAVGRGRVGFGPMPSTENVADSISELADRTTQLLDRIHDVNERLSDEIGLVRQTLGEMNEQIRDNIEQLRDSDSKVATSGIRLEAIGLFFIAAGVVLQWVGTLLS